MQYLPNGMQMKEADTYTIEQEHIPSSKLMERAANACVSCMIDSGYDLGNILIVCGKRKGILSPCIKFSRLSVTNIHKVNIVL